jgi:uncharacterized protein with HEPN domain
MILYRPGRRFTARPCEQIAGFRNRIIHEYAEVDAEVVWAIVQNEVPRLLEKSKTLLKEEQ